MLADLVAIVYQIRIVSDFGMLRFNEDSEELSSVCIRFRSVCVYQISLCVSD